MATSASEIYLDDDFARWINSLLVENHLPGMSIAVIKNGEIEASGYGISRLPDILASGDTLYPMASTTKSFTTALVGLLVQQSASADVVQGQASVNKTNTLESSLLKEGWKTPVSRILPHDFVTTDEYTTQNATLEDIASHRSGIVGHPFIGGPLWGNSLSVSARSLQHLEPSSGTLRCAWQYNNLMYGVLGQVAEVIGRNNFETLLREKILAPLGMTNTWNGIDTVVQAVRDGDIKKTDVARGYFWHKIDPDNSAEKSTGGSKRGYFLPEQYGDVSCFGPAGSLISSVKDYAKWVKELLEAANASSKDTESSQMCVAGERKPVISNALWQELTTPRIHISPFPFRSEIFPPRRNDHATPMSYALGWVIDTYMHPGELIIHHSGGLPGFGTLVLLLPNRNFGLVLAGNGGMTNNIGESVAKELVGRRLGDGKLERRKRPDKDAKEEVRKKEISRQTTELDAENGSTADLSTINLNSRVHHVELEGKYHNPAYNTFSITKAPSSVALDSDSPSIDGIRIIRRGEAGATHVAARSLGNPLLVTPLGKRVVSFRLLLHPFAMQPYTDKIVYTLEVIQTAGDLSNDPAPELDPGYGGEDDPRYPGKKISLWQSVSVTKKGAVAELVDGADMTVRRLGLQMAHVLGYTKGDESDEGLLIDGWDRKVIWFSRVHS